MAGSAPCILRDGRARGLLRPHVRIEAAARPVAYNDRGLRRMSRRRASCTGDGPWTRLSLMWGWTRTRRRSQLRWQSLAGLVRCARWAASPTSRRPSRGWQNGWRRLTANCALLRGRTMRLRAAPPADSARPRLRGGGAVADPAPAGRAGEDRPARWYDAGAQRSRRRAGAGVGAGSGARGNARLGARPRAGRGGTAAASPASASAAAAAQPDLAGQNELDGGSPRLDWWACVAAFGASVSGRRSPGGVRRGPGTPRPADPGDRGAGARLALGPGGSGAASNARYRSDLGGDPGRRYRRRRPLPDRTPADGLFGSGAQRALEWAQAPTGRHHQSRQQQRTASARRGRLDLSQPTAADAGDAGTPERSAQDGARHRLEGATAPVRPLSRPRRAAQAEPRHHHRDCARDGGLYLGDRPHRPIRPELISGRRQTNQEAPIDPRSTRCAS